MLFVVHMRGWEAATTERSKLAGLFGRVQRMRDAHWDNYYDGTLLSLAFFMWYLSHFYCVYFVISIWWCGCRVALRPFAA
jgi:hypothetical protein